MDFKSLFLLDPAIHFFNHGSFGACPQPVFEAYQATQLLLERQPVKFIGREFAGQMRTARTALSAYLNYPADGLVYFPNPTTAINMVARSLPLQPGDEILATDHEYGAMDRTWRFITTKAAAHYRNQPIATPYTNDDDFIAQFWKGVTPRTKYIFISHMTSQTALRFPVAQVCERARAEGILTIIDGAHIPGHLPLDLLQLGADIYTGACHKWLCAPKGAAFLAASPAAQSLLEPLIVSWGYEAEIPGDSRFIDHHEYQGTTDPAAYLSVPAAIQFLNQHNWPKHQAEMHQRAIELRQELLARYPVKSLSIDDTPIGQMFAIQIPFTEPVALQSRLYEKFAIEVPVYYWQDQVYLRISLQVYNTAEDFNALFDALDSCW